MHSFIKIDGRTGRLMFVMNRWTDGWMDGWTCGVYWIYQYINGRMTEKAGACLYKCGMLVYFITYFLIIMAINILSFHSFTRC